MVLLYREFLIGLGKFITILGEGNSTLPREIVPRKIYTPKKNLLNFLKTRIEIIKNLLKLFFTVASFVLIIINF